MKNLIKRFWKNESGATAVEYGLVAVLVAVTIIVAARSLGTQVGVSLNKTQTTMKSA